MNGLILAAGTATRWECDTPKQLITYQGETLVARTARMLKEHRLIPIIVTHDQRIANAVGCKAFEPKASRYTLETLLSTRELWGNEVIITLGDVLYSRRAMDRLLATEFLAIGSAYERFGLRIRYKDFGMVQRLAKEAIAMAEQTERPKYGKLGNLCKLYAGLGFEATSSELIGKSVEDVNDGFIRDFDAVSAVENFQREVACGLVEVA